MKCNPLPPGLGDAENEFWPPLDSQEGAMSNPKWTPRVAVQEKPGDGGYWLHQVGNFTCIGTAYNKADAVLWAAAPELAASLEDVSGLIQSGYLIRDTSRDGEPDWALAFGQVESARKLARVRALLDRINQGGP